jgi:putative sterol carrier protein
MTDPITDFLEELRQRGHEPLLEMARGSMRFEIVNGKKVDRWLVVVDKGDLTVSHRGGTADTTLRGDRAAFDALARGELSPVSAVLRGVLTVEGSWRLLVVFRRILPGPRPGKRRATVRERSRR